ncbi:hypothetical protein [Streptomyces sp. NPDC006335]|uniref:hypothetical protein n=1 Tax=Streptomyces sp. NPDC006335 TaxID=3156895 RepID=UPI0033A849D5
MSSVVVRNEAGPSSDSLVDRLLSIGAESLPVVQAVTGLPLPDPVVIRTMTVDKWLREHQESAKRRLVAETEQLAPSLRERLTAKVKHRARTTFLSTFWPTMAAETVLFEPGRPEVVLLPEALEHAGRLDDIPFLYKALGHEMTHLGQYAASDGAVWTAQEAFFPARSGTADRAYEYLLEGHAYWADREITTKILGNPVSTDKPSPEASDRYRKLFAMPMRLKVIEEYRRACDSIARIIDVHGLAALNKIWTNPDLVPRRKETDDLVAWTARLTEGHAA